MKKEKFIELWETHSSEWYKKATIKYNGKEYKVSDICTIKDNHAVVAYEKYEYIKKLTKQLYFGDTKKRINRFKRAAVVLYSICLSDPIEYKSGYSDSDAKIGSLMIKQRLSFHIALNSIIMQYPKDKVELLYDIDHIFDFSITSNGVGNHNADTFLEGIYKDIFFSEIYRNYNILTMANVFLLLTEKSSKLSKI